MIEELCQNLDSTKGPGHDDIAPCIVKSVSHEISKPLSQIINTCIEAGHYPDSWKIARVSPVFKQGDPTSFSNYRPISVLSVFSEIFEKIIQKRILSYLHKQSSVLGTQYGFRQGHSTYMAIMDMVENVREAWEKDEHCLGIFIDFKKAFDTVDFSILFAKLENLGIRGLPLKLIKSYFSKRKQYVIFKGVESTLW